MADHPPLKRVKVRHLIWIAAAGLAMVVLAASSLDLKSLHEHAGRLNGILVFALMAVLPLFGLPASVLYALGGAKFGHVWGLAIVALAIAVHLFGSWWIGHSWLRKPLDRLLSRLRYHKPQVPQGDYVPFCLLIALIPGVPYTLKNYILVLGGVPWRPFFWTCWPAHFVSATLGVLFGDFTESMTPAKIAFLVGYAIVLAVLSRYVIRRLSSRASLDSPSPLAAKDQPAGADTSAPECR